MPGGHFGSAGLDKRTPTLASNGGTPYPGRVNWNRTFLLPRFARELPEKSSLVQWTMPQLFSLSLSLSLSISLCLLHAHTHTLFCRVHQDSKHHVDISTTLVSHSSHLHNHPKFIYIAYMHHKCLNPLGAPYKKDRRIHRAGWSPIEGGEYARKRKGKRDEPGTTHAPSGEIFWHWWAWWFMGTHPVQNFHVFNLVFKFFSESKNRV